MNLGYIDPGTGSMLLQIILGGLAAAAVFLKLFWHRVLVLLRIRKPLPPERESEAGKPEQPAADRATVERAGEPVGRR
jgi:hypothetical protein